MTERCDAELGQEPAAELAARLPLTARQLAVARAVASGKSNREVARELYISVKTVEFHVSQILVRLGVDGRAEITAALGDHAADRPVGRGPDRGADHAVAGRPS
ncbi:MAG: response regulator transcription factor [Streptosporangiaceae bacterium]